MDCRAKPGNDWESRVSICALTVSDDQIFRAVWYLSLLLMVLAATVPLARSRQGWLRNAAWWVLIGGFLFALYRVGEWLL